MKHAVLVLPDALSMRITEADLDAIKAEAAKQGVPYQTLVGSVLHKYATGKWVAKE